MESRFHWLLRTCSSIAHHPPKGPFRLSVRRVETPRTPSVRSNPMISFRNIPKDAFPISAGFAVSFLLHGVGFVLAPLLTVNEVSEIGIQDSELIYSVKLVSAASENSLTEPEEMSMQQLRRAVAGASVPLLQRVKMTYQERRPSTYRQKQKHRSESPLVSGAKHLLPPIYATSSNPIQKPGEPTSLKEVQDIEKPSLSFRSIGGVIEPQRNELLAESPTDTSSDSTTESSGTHKRRSRYLDSPLQDRPGHVSAPAFDVEKDPPQTVAAAAAHQKTVVIPSVEIQVRAPVESADQNLASSFRSDPKGLKPRGKFVPAHPRAKNPVPHYPASAKRRLLEGCVVLAVSVNDKGDVESVTVREPSIWQILDEAAASAVARWRFVPASRGGNSVDSVVLLPVVFQLSPEPRAKS